MTTLFKLLSWHPSKSRSAGFTSVFAIAMTFALLSYFGFLSFITKLPFKVFEMRPLTNLLAIFLWVPICVLPYIFMYQRYLAESRELIVPVAHRLRTALTLFMLTYLTMSSTYLSGATGITDAFSHYWFYWSDEKLLLAVLPFAGWAFFAYLICKVRVDRPDTDAVKTFGSLFSTSGIFIWGLFIFFDHQSRVRYDFADYYPESQFNLDALNFVWYTITSISVAIGYLLAIRFHPWTRVWFLAPSISTLPPDEKSTRADDTVKDA